MYLKFLLFGLTVHLIIAQKWKALENLDEKIDAWKNTPANATQVKSWGQTSCKPIVNILEIIVRVLISLLVAVTQLIDQLYQMIKYEDPMKEMLEVLLSKGLLGVIILLLKLIFDIK